MTLDPYDYLRIQTQMDFQCQRCGHCCQVADPIDLYPKDIRRLASFFNISEEEAIEEYTIPHPSETDLLAFKATAPCRFYDDAEKGCKIYQARPMVCRCSPFLRSGYSAQSECKDTKEAGEGTSQNDADRMKCDVVVIGAGPGGQWLPRPRQSRA